MQQEIFSTLADDAMTPCGLAGAQVTAFVMRALIAPSGRGKSPLFTAETLAERPIYIQPTEADMANIPTNSIIVVADYPWGRTGKCVRVSYASWRDKYGYKILNATSDSAFAKFNAVKDAGTYTMGVISLGWKIEENGKEHAEFNVHPLNVYDIKFASKVGSVQAYKEKAEALLKLNLTAHDAEFVNYYLTVCNKKIDILTQQV